MGFTFRGWMDHLAKTLSEEYRPVRCTRCTGQVNVERCTRRKVQTKTLSAVEEGLLQLYLGRRNVLDGP